MFAARSARRSWAVRLRRTVLLSLVAGFLTLVGGASASAAPVQDLNNLPSVLKKYVPSSQEFAAAPWMTSPACKDKGGDFSIWATSIVNDTPALLTHFMAKHYGPETLPEDKPRSDAILAGYRQLATEVPAILPPGYCVDDVKRWTGPDYATKPWGFPWGVTPGEKGKHQTLYSCVDAPNSAPEITRNQFLGAERAPCDGFYVVCDKAPENEKAKCEAWNTFSDEYVRRVTALRGKAIDEHKATATADTETKVMSPGEIIGKVAGGWFTDLTRTIAEGSAKLMAEAMTFWTRTDRTTMLQSPAITEIQGMLKYIGIVLLAASVIWQGIMLIYKRKLDPLVGTAMGLLSFAGWSTLGGAVAVLLNEAGIALADQVLDQSIDKFSKTVGDSMLGQVGVATGAIFFLSIILFFLACIQWVLGFFRMGALVILLALLPTAAAGQVNESTKPWLKKVLSWCLSLILYQPIAAIIFAIGLLLIGNSKDFSTVLVGMAVIAMAVISMPTMLRFFDWGGQRLVGGGSGAGGAMALGAAASTLGGGGPGGFGRHMDQSGPGGNRGGGQEGRDNGAVPVTSAHGGDGPGAPPGGGGGAPANNPGGQQGGTGAPTQGVAAATGGQPGGAPGGSAPAGAETSGGTTGGAAGGSASGGSASGGGAGGAAAGGAGAAITVAQQGVNAAAGAMTDGAGESGGTQ